MEGPTLAILGDNAPSVEINDAVVSVLQPLRTITTCAGIGDSIWIMQKLINAKERFHFKIPDGTPQRGKPLFDLLPGIAESCTYSPGLSYNFLKRNSVGNPSWSAIKEKEFILEANSHLESGRRIEGFLPDLPTTYRLHYNTTESDTQAANLYFNKDKKFIGIYTSAYSNARNQGAWGVDEWFEFCKLLYKKDMCYVLLGAEYDTGITEDLTARFKEFNIDYISAIGEPLGVTIEILKRLNYFAGFPSGLSILNETLGKDGVMFYNRKDKGIINTWAEPERIKTGGIKECLFCSPRDIYDWMKNEYHIFDKL